MPPQRIDNEQVSFWQRILAANLILLNGECLVLAGYISLGAYTITLNGDATLVIL